MPGMKLIVLYPPPKDSAEFERVYFADHIPMVAPVLKEAGGTKVVLTRITGTPAGPAPFHRMAEIHFPSMDSLVGFAGSKGGQDAVAHANQISTGGPAVFMIAEEEVVTL